MTGGGCAAVELTDWWSRLRAEVAATAPDFAAYLRIDPTRQQHVWDDDLRPEDEHAYFWYLEVGQCCGLAITRDGGDPASGSSYDWDGATCVGRGLVLAVRGLRMPGVDLGALLADVRGALAA